MVRQNFYMGQRITPDNLNALQDYAEQFYIEFLMHAFGSGRFKGLSVTHTDKFVATIEKGACIDANGSLCILKEDTVIDVSEFAPSSLLIPPVSVYVYLDSSYEKTDAVVDVLGETQHTTLTPSVKVFYSTSYIADQYTLLAEIITMNSDIVVIDEKLPLLFSSTSS